MSVNPIPLEFLLARDWLLSQKAAPVIDSTNRPADPVTIFIGTDAERADVDLAYHKYKLNGGHHRDNDARALRLQQRYEPHL